MSRQEDEEQNSRLVIRWTSHLITGIGIAPSSLKALKQGVAVGVLRELQGGGGFAR